MVVKCAFVCKCFISVCACVGTSVFWISARPHWRHNDRLRCEVDAQALLILEYKYSVHGVLSLFDYISHRALHMGLCGRSMLSITHPIATHGCLYWFCYIAVNLNLFNIWRQLCVSSTFLCTDFKAVSNSYSLDSV